MAQLATSSSSDCRSYSSRARSSRSRHEVTPGRRRSSARRSRSVIPPQTPNSIPLSSASARHSVRTGQPRKISLARFFPVPWTNNSAGAVALHAARVVQSVIHMCPLLLIVEHESPTVVSMGLRSRGECVRPPCHGYPFVIQQLTEVEPGCQDPGLAIYQIVLTGYIHGGK